jgi:hypothetical protein
MEKFQNIVDGKKAMELLKEQFPELLVLCKFTYDKKHNAIMVETKDGTKKDIKRTEKKILPFMHNLSWQITDADLEDGAWLFDNEADGR